jgi:hypothetical protein
MKTGAKTKTKKEGDVKFVLDADAIKTGVSKLFESDKATKKAALLKMFESAGVKVTPEEDDEIDRNLGIVDGGAIDKVLDDATGVDEPDEPNEGAVGPSKPGTEDDMEVEAMPDDPKFLKADARSDMR